IHFCRGACPAKHDGSTVTAYAPQTKGFGNKRRYVVQRNKRQLLSEFDGVQHRTRRLNSAIALIYQNNNKLQGKKNGTSLPFLDLSREVELAGFEPASKQATYELSTCLVCY